MKNHEEVCCDPFRVHTERVICGVSPLSGSAYFEFQRLGIFLSENDSICVHCVKQLRYKILEKQSSESPIMDHQPDNMIDMASNSAPAEAEAWKDSTSSYLLVCCDPFKTHTKVITSGICRLPKKLFAVSQSHNFKIEEDASICVNCLKKLQIQYKDDVKDMPLPPPEKNVMKVCVDPYKMHKKLITSGLRKLSDKYYRKCLKLGVRVSMDSQICTNCLKKLQLQSRGEAILYGYNKNKEVLSLPVEGDVHASYPEGYVGGHQLPQQGEYGGESSSCKRKMMGDGEEYDQKIHRPGQYAGPPGNMNYNNYAKGRGALIVLEGCDRTGKTTQAHKLVESLMASGRKSEFMRFPDRTTKIGSIIDSYLACSSELEDHAIHLLFSANRWESLPRIVSSLQSGTNIIVDRYAFSGVAFSAAKQGMNLEWCKQSDKGLPKPDLVLFLDLNSEEIQRRAHFGEERYEEGEFQKRVYHNYGLLRDETWKIIDANKSIDDLHEELKYEAMKLIGSIEDKKIEPLWI